MKSTEPNNIEIMSGLGEKKTKHGLKYPDF